jgi:hypothetical protein
VGRVDVRMLNFRAGQLRAVGMIMTTLQSSMESTMIVIECRS